MLTEFGCFFWLSNSDIISLSSVLYIAFVLEMLGSTVLNDIVSHDFIVWTIAANNSKLTELFDTSDKF